MTQPRRIDKSILSDLLGKFKEEMIMKFRYIITIGADEEPLCVSQEREAGTVTVLITARTLEEAKRLFQGVRI